MAKRERFERTDVPAPGNSVVRTIVGILVIILVFGACGFAFFKVRDRVTRETHLLDSDLEDAIEDQASMTVPDAYVLSDDTFDNVLLLTAASLEGEDVELTSATIVSVNTTANTARKVSVATTIAVTYSDSTYRLSDLYASLGPTGVVEGLSKSANITFDHVVVSTEDVLDKILDLAGTSEDADVVKAASSLLDVAITDMGEKSLITFADALDSVGAANIITIELPTYAETMLADDGSIAETGFTRIDSNSLLSSLGIISIAPQEEAEPEGTETEAEAEPEYYQ